MALRYGQKPRIVVEESPWGDFFASVPDTVLAYMQLQNQIEQRQLDREFQLEGMALTAAAEDYRFLRGQKADWEKELVTKGYKLPEYDRTVAGTDSFDRTTEGYQDQSGILEGNIGKLTTSLANIASAADEAKGLSDLYGKEIKARKGEEWRDYLLEGGITIGEGGELVGTDEMAVYLETLRTGTPGQKQQYEKLKDANYRRSLQSSLRTIEEAKNLQAIDVQLEQANLAMDAARLNIDKSEFEYSVAQLTHLDTQVADIYKNTALSVKASFRYISDGASYSITDLFSLAATDIDDFMDVKQGFLDDPLNYAIAHEAEAFISGVQQAAASGMDDSEFVVKFQKGAYDNYIQLQTLTETLMRNASAENKSLKEFLEALPASDTTKATYKRLNDKHTGYKRLGLFRVGHEMLDRSAQVVNMDNEAQALRLSLDASTAEQIANQGLGLRELEDYSPMGELTPKMQQDLEISLATLKSYSPSTDPAVVGASTVYDQQISADSSQLSQINASLDALQSIGMGQSPDAMALRSEISQLSQQISRTKQTKAFTEQSAEMFPGTYYTSIGGRIITEEEIEQAANATGKTIEEIKMVIKQQQEALQRDQTAPYVRPGSASAYGRRLK